jgi:hypothetical protein
MLSRRILFPGQLMSVFNWLGRYRTTGIVAHTCVPWSGMMVKRITSYSRRIQHTLPNEDKEAVSSDVVSYCDICE